MRQTSIDDFNLIILYYVDGCNSSEYFKVERYDAINTIDHVVKRV